MKNQIRPTVTSKRSAFTLVELLVVVAVIGVLASIAFPRYMEAIQRTQLAKQQSVISAIEKAKDKYSLDTVRSTGTLPTGFNVRAEENKFSVLSPYLSTGGTAVGSRATLAKGTGKATFSVGDILEGGTSTSSRTSAAF